MAARHAFKNVVSQIKVMNPDVVFAQYLYALILLALCYTCVECVLFPSISCH